MIKNKNRQILVLDTSVLVHDPNAINTFSNSEIYLPITILEELDKVKKLPNDAGRNARVAIKQLDLLADQGSIHQGIKVDNNNILKIDINDYGHLGADANYGDNRILACARKLQNSHKNQTVVLVSRDINLRVRAKACGLTALDYNKNRTNELDFYTGIKKINNEEMGASLISDGELILDEFEELQDLYPNECVMFLTADNKFIAAGRKYKDHIKLIREKNPWGLIPKNPEQQFAIDLIMDPKIPLVSLVGSAGTGKAQPLDAKILTPNGWKIMGDIEIGDNVSTPNGKFAKVIGTFPQGRLDIYKVFFSDGTSTECCGNHLWETKTSKERDGHKLGKVRTTLEIKNSLIFNGKKNHSIPITKPIEMSSKPLVIDPYSFGCLIGDGCFRHHFSFTSADEYIVEHLDAALSKINLRLVYKEEYGYNICGKDRKIKNEREIIACSNDTINKIYENINEVIVDGYSKHSVYKAISKNKILYGLKWKYGKYKTSSILYNYLMDNNLWMKYSHEKFIPDDYKYSSIENRIALLQGLMDTDGSVGKTGKYFDFSTTSPLLVDDIKWIVQSLGGTTTVSSRFTYFTHRGVKKRGKLLYRIVLSLPNNINPFRLPRKANKVQDRIKYHPRRYITNIELIGKKEAKCILIEDKEHLYMTNDCIITHNTLISLASSLELVLNQKRYNTLSIYRPMQSFGPGTGYLPGGLEEKLNPWFAAIDDSFSILFSGNSKKKNSWKETLYQYMDDGTIQKECLSYIRGRSMPNSLIIIDELQNCSKEEVKTIITRVGQNSKIILTGDIQQIDNIHLDATNNGLTYLIEKFKEYDVAAHITLTKGERSLLASIAADIL